MKKVSPAQEPYHFKTPVLHRINVRLETFRVMNTTICVQVIRKQEEPT
jgi:hypothetical protein